MALGPFTAEAASNLPSGTDAHRRRRAGSPDHVSTLSGPGICPYPAGYPGGPAKARLSRPGFPLPFRPPAFASWSSCARQGTGPSSRSACRSCCQGRTLTGLPRSARMSCGRGGCPLYPGDCGARTAGRSSPAAACRLAVKGHRDFPVGGQLISLRVDRLCPCWRSADLLAGQVSGVTPFPAVASASRRLVPSVRTKWAWCSRRSTVAVARVLGMIVSNPLGCRLEVTIRDRRS